MSLHEKYNQVFWRLLESGKISDKEEFEYLVDKIILHYLLAFPAETRLKAVEDAVASLTKLQSDLIAHKTELEKEITE